MPPPPSSQQPDTTSDLIRWLKLLLFQILAWLTAALLLNPA
jgi:hypothetical protein